LKKSISKEILKEIALVAAALEVEALFVDMVEEVLLLKDLLLDEEEEKNSTEVQVLEEEKALSLHEDKSFYTSLS
jgi:hypothetical protein